jgi:uncharacterized protein involved in outer membrane biogenesis
MVKKALKIVGIILLLLVVSAFAIPYFFKDQIKAKIEKAINEKVDAKVAFADADLSLFKNFPNASVTIEKLSIVNKAPFEGDTLVAFDELLSDNCSTAKMNRCKLTASIRKTD